MVSTQGFCDPPIPKIAAEGRGFRETEYRNYVAGRMDIRDPLAEALFLELKKRTRSCLLVVWKGAELEKTHFQSEDDIFIHRTRTAKTRDNLSDVPWEVLKDLRFIKSDLRRLRSIYGETYEDFFQFLVIERTAGLSFTPIQMIEDALLELSGDPSAESLMRKSVGDILLENEKESYMETVASAITYNISRPELIVHSVAYEGNRSRCWDVEHVLPRLLETTKGKKVSIEYSRFISAICKDLETNGTIRIMEKFVPPQGVACAFPGSDGRLDLYIDYGPLLATCQPTALDSRFNLPPEESLLCFAKDFENRNARAIYTKGSIVTKYCAWPMDAMGSRTMGLPNFTTPAGHIYQWIQAPFDYPFAANFWQCLLSHYFQECSGFACFHLTTFVVCAVDQEDARDKMNQLYEVAQKHSLRLRIPPLSMWTDDCERLGLDKIYDGVRPAGYEL